MTGEWSDEAWTQGSWYWHCLHYHVKPWGNLWASISHVPHWLACRWPDMDHWPQGLQCCLTLMFEASSPNAQTPRAPWCLSIIRKLLGCSPDPGPSLPAGRKEFSVVETGKLYIFYRWEAKLWMTLNVVWNGQTQPTGVTCLRLCPLHHHHPIQTCTSWKEQCLGQCWPSFFTPLFQALFCAFLHL